jgi:DNA modification methylase
VTIQLYCGDCLDILPTLEAASVDCVITDPPYPMIKRDYGITTEVAWMEMMKALIPEVRRVLKPSGSAVFILQPNSERIGKMRLWLWDFMSWVGREWGVLQDVYWWNISALPDAFSNQGDLMRSSIKPMVWCGEETAYRNQSAILWKETERNAAMRQEARMNLRYSPSGVHHVRNGKMGQAAEIRGGVTPFNLLPIANSNSVSSAGAHSHEAGTPYALADWWTRYICPHGGTVLDPFGGSGTMGLAAIANGCDFIGIEKMDKHYQTMRSRVEAEQQKPRTLRMEMTPDLPY